MRSLRRVWGKCRDRVREQLNDRGSPLRKVQARGGSLVKRIRLELRCKSPLVIPGVLHEPYTLKAYFCKALRRCFRQRMLMAADVPPPHG